VRETESGIAVLGAVIPQARIIQTDAKNINKFYIKLDWKMQSGIWSFFIIDFFSPYLL
jgi:hypothetical protein